MAGFRSSLTLSAALAAALVAASTALGIPGDSTVPGATPSATTPAYDASAEYQQGVDLLNAGQFAEAEAAFDKVIFAAPENADARFMKGMALAGQDKLFPARVAFESALHYAPDHIGAHRELGVTFAKMGNAQRAQEELDGLKARADACAGSCAEAADLTAAVQAIEAALGSDSASLERDLRQALLGPVQGDAAYLSAVGLINEGRYENAITILKQAELAFGPHPDVLTYLGFANRKLQRYDEAERYYHAALEIAPEHRGATEYLGELRVEQGNLPEARRLLARLESLCAFGCAEADELRRWVDEAS
jgi:tetratricopeptide (TPR) repeat protein